MADVIIHRQGVAGRITLNRPQALHALNEEMCLAMDAALQAWADDDEIEVVVVDHAEGTRGFCAGGDIRMLAESGAADGSAAQAFFRSAKAAMALPRNAVASPALCPILRVQISPLFILCRCFPREFVLCAWRWGRCCRWALVSPSPRSRITCQCMMGRCRGRGRIFCGTWAGR